MKPYTRNGVVETALKMKKVYGKKGAYNTFIKPLGMFPSYQYWCAMFIVWVFREHGQANSKNKNVAVPWSASVVNMMNWYKKRNRWETKTYKAQPGDLIVYKFSRNNVPNHIGIVVKTTDKHVHTIEGNTTFLGLKNSVATKKVKRNSSTIVGYCLPVGFASSTATTRPKPKLNWISSSRSLSQLEMQNNAKIINDYFSSKGWTSNAIAALLANLEAESTINPGRWQSGLVNNLKGGFGLAQWTPATKITNWQKSKGKAIGDGYGQLDRIEHERKNELQWMSVTVKMTFNEFSKSKASLAHLTRAFTVNYERPKNMEQRAKERIPLADKWYKFINNYNAKWGGSNGGGSYEGDHSVLSTYANANSNAFQDGGVYYKFARIPSTEETMDRAAIGLDQITRGLFRGGKDNKDNNEDI